MSLSISEQIGRVLTDYGPKSGPKGHDNFILNEGTLGNYKDVLTKIFSDNKLKDFVDLELSRKRLTLTLKNSKDETFKFIITVGKDEKSKNPRGFIKIQYGGADIQPFEKILHGEVWTSKIAEDLNRFLGKISSYE